MNIEERFRRIVTDILNVDPASVTDQARFREDLGADSLDEVDISIDAEEEFGVTINDIDWMTAYTFGDAIRLITKAAG